MSNIALTDEKLKSTEKSSYTNGMATARGYVTVHWSTISLKEKVSQNTTLKNKHIKIKKKSGAKRKKYWVNQL